MKYRNIPRRIVLLLPLALALCLALPAVLHAGGGAGGAAAGQGASAAAVAAAAQAEGGAGAVGSLSEQLDVAMKAFQDASARLASAADADAKGRIREEVERYKTQARNIISQIMEQADNVEAKVASCRAAATAPLAKKLDRIMAFVNEKRQAAAAARLG